MKEVTKDVALIAKCGLYCGACGSYRKGRCPGCHENAKAGWCTVRSCCQEHHFDSCADCKEFADPRDCRKHNNVISKLMGLVLNSDRCACVLKLRELGRDGFAQFMTEHQIQTLPRRGAVKEA